MRRLHGLQYFQTSGKYYSGRDEAKPTQGKPAANLPLTNNLLKTNFENQRAQLNAQHFTVITASTGSVDTSVISVQNLLYVGKKSSRIQQHNLNGVQIGVGAGLLILNI